MVLSYVGKVNYSKTRLWVRLVGTWYSVVSYIILLFFNQVTLLSNKTNLSTNDHYEVVLIRALTTLSQEFYLK
jgi:hypothetical protein